MESSNRNKPIIGISSCLLGEKVRYDGAHKYDEWVNEKLKCYFDLSAICPEVAMGLTVPREPMKIIRDKSTGEHVLLNHTGTINHTANILETSEKLLAKMPKISGYIFMKKSPTCGVERVKIYESNNLSVHHMGRGFWAQAVVTANPNLPVIDSGRLFDDDERDHFLRRVMMHFRFHCLDGSIEALQDFHARNKFLLLEYNQSQMRCLGKIAANSNNTEKEITYKAYADELFKTLAILPSKKNRLNTFMHLVGYFKNDLSNLEKQMMQRMFADFANNLIPYQVPYRMILFLIEKYQHYYLKNHYYLDPYPKELMPKI